MAIIKWEPMNSMLDDFFNEEDVFMPMRRANRLVPAIDMYEDKDNVYIETALSGIDPEKVNITVEDDILKLEGSAEHKSEVDEKNYYRKEIRSGHFTRAVALPKKVKADQTKAEYKDGILKVTLPKSEDVKPKPIKVEVKK
ncbi:MAG: Hsp20/alpha crystallin family protein [Candidatus Kerfeldbacteria bacterium CG08_land_8_20_14_0_20_42_7]|uniref:Hsp20/alpha crystallin family protein n=1 Tax=Candidatus Kerfeldbacteria bacterium CG08_land_8_20_14_0_20_42_7 TaxID=2014245 RepID=A0A2H0YTW4_9BACT|nr:MAG: Hsp20/alpha crystallin family protein [Candidatus Kerfeldbacteria bacterium CG08_land_8_20_14_0_20_42_7]